MTEKETGIKDLPGVGPATAQKLEEAGYNNLISIAVASPRELIEASGLTENAARKVINTARKSASLGFESGSQLLEKRAKVIKLTTGSKAFDALMEGGFESGAITECYGQFGSAKCIDKDTPVFYFNPEKPHLDSISEMYTKYKMLNGEVESDGGHVVTLDTVSVISLTKDGLKKTKASHLYKMHAKNIYEIKTRRGRTIKLSAPHKLVTFDNGLCWKPARLLNKGDLIACPDLLKSSSEDIYSFDDAYFLGLFVAEGSSNPLSISTGSEVIRDWLFGYLSNRFNYEPTVRVDRRRINPVYTILIRTPTKEILGKLSESNSSTKFVPEDMFAASEGVIKYFLAGYLDGDGYLSKEIASMTTKSKKLSSGLSYLFKMLGVCVTHKKQFVDGKEYQSLYISGKGKLNLNGLPLKIKTFDYSFKNSSFGYSKDIIKFVRKSYKKFLGGNRGPIAKAVGKKLNGKDTFYGYLTAFNYENKTMNEKTFLEIRKVFYSGLINVGNCLKDALKLEKLNQEEFVKLHEKLPFPFNSLRKNLSLSDSGIRNYVQRNLPKDRTKLKKVLCDKLTWVREGLIETLKTLKNAAYFEWDKIESVREVEYNDFIYDLVVPEGHSFIGGDMPLVLHNTQIGHQLAVNIQLPKEKGGADGMAVYIDTENTFRPERIKQMAEGVGLNPEEVLNNMKVARAYNSDHQMLLLDKVEDLIVNEKLPIKLIIVDSLIGHFRSEFVGRGTLADRQQKLNKHMHALLRLADLYGVVVYVTNQVSSDPAAFFGDPTKPVGGNIVGHACLTADTLLQFSDGEIKPISQIEKPRGMISSNFENFNNINSFCDYGSVRRDIKEIFEIYADSKIKASPEHKFFRLDGFEIKEVAAKNLKKGDFVACANKIEILGEGQILPVVETKSMVIVKKDGISEIKQQLLNLGLTREEACNNLNITPRQLRRVLNQGYATEAGNFQLLINQGVNKQVYEFLEPYTSYKHRNIVIPNTLSVELAQILGYFLGDGNLEKGSIRFKDQRKEVLEVYQNLCKRVFGICGRISKVSNKDCYRLDINSKAAKELVKKIKTDLFSYVSKSSKEHIRMFIRGFMDAEGFVSKKRPTVSISQKDELTLRYIQLMLLRFGIRSRLRFSKKAGCNGWYTLQFDGRDFLKFAEEIGVSALDKKKLMDKWKKYCIREGSFTKEDFPIERKLLWDLLSDLNLHPSKFMRPRPSSYRCTTKDNVGRIFDKLDNLNITNKEVNDKIDFMKRIFNGDIRFEKVRKLNLIKNNEPLYDISVPIAENYIANGFVVHNSTFRIYLRKGKKGSRVAKLVDAPATPDGECIFNIVNEGIRDI